MEILPKDRTGMREGFQRGDFRVKMVNETWIGMDLEMEEKG